MKIKHAGPVISQMTVRACYIVYWGSFSNKVLALLRRRVLSPVLTSVASR
jgi:hypothetical protein